MMPEQRADLIDAIAEALDDRNDADVTFHKFAEHVVERMETDTEVRGLLCLLLSEPLPSVAAVTALPSESLEARQRENGCNQDDDSAAWGVPCCDGCFCAATVQRGAIYRDADDLAVQIAEIVVCNNNNRRNRLERLLVAFAAEIKRSAIEP